jgi:hypothetical protein
MPNWKELITSGSNANLNSLTVVGTVSANAFSGDGSSLSNLSIPSTFTKNIVGGSLSYNIDHNLSEAYPIVQVYDGNGYQVIPKDVISISSSRVQVNFSDEFSGTIVVKK